MGENEQSGMLRNVVVVGIIAMLTLIMILSFFGLKSNMTKNTNSAVGTVVTTKLPYYGKDIAFTNYTPSQNAWLGPRYRLPYIGNIPANNWRDIMIELTPKTTDVSVTIDINDYLTQYTDGNNNDNDDISKRTFEIRNTATNEIISKNAGAELKAGTTYSISIRYFNNTNHVLYDSKSDDTRTAIVIVASDGHSPISVTINSIEAATYDNAYAQ